MSLYGCQLWDFENPHCDKFFTAWRKCVRHILGIPYQTHCRLLHLICNDFPVNVQLFFRFLNFITSCHASKSKCVFICIKTAVAGSKSKVSNSLSYMCNKLSISRYDEKFELVKIKDKCITETNICDNIKAGIIHDFLLLYRHTKDDNLMDLTRDICIN